MIRADGPAARPVLKCCQRCGRPFWRPPLPGLQREFCSDKCQQDVTRGLNYSPEPTTAQRKNAESQPICIKTTAVPLITCTVGEWMDARYPQFTEVLG